MDAEAGVNLRFWSLWTALLLVATALRLPFPAWDAGIAAHPDERFLIGVAEATSLWGDPTRTAPDFPYGHLPVYLARLVVLAAPGSDPLYALRLLSGLIGVLLVAVTGALGRQLLGTWGAFWAAALMAVAPFPIQQAHFYTVDPLGATLASIAVLAALRRRWRTAGALLGLAVACKASLVWLGVPLGLAMLSAGESRARAGRSLLLAAGVTFALAAPWALLRSVAAWRGPLIQAGMAAGRFDFPYTRQYAGTLPWLYPLTQLALWGLGPAVAPAGLLGLALAAFYRRRCSFAQRVAWIWTVAFWIAVAGLYVKYPRYLLPLYPVWAGWAVFAVRHLFRKPAVRLAVCAFGLLLPTALLGWAQFSLYAQPHPWAEASRWIYAYLPPGATVAVEAWDHPLPVPLPEGEPERYTQITLPVFDADTPEKRAALAAATQQADVIVLASRRGYGALARQPERYAATLAWYREVLEQREVVAFARCPRLGALALTDDPLVDAGLPVPLSPAERCGMRTAVYLPRLDESFRVYDAPVVWLLMRSP